jgi:hypothetical protein
MAFVKKKYQQQWGSKGSYLDKDVAVKLAPSPIGGWDALSPLAAMEAKYASILVNWVPRTGWCEVRGGYNVWGQHPNTSSVDTLMTYRPPLGSEKLFAAQGTEIWDVSSYGIPTLSKSSIGSAFYQYLNFTPALGSSYLMCVNGVDQLLTYNGTTWANQTITGAGSAIFIGINAFKRRVWLVPPNSTIVYFLGTDAITGAATALDLGSFMTHGGYVMAMGTWTMDGGNGPDDMAIFVTSRGQVIQYKGTDPTNANAWALVGTFNLPPPISRRCLYRFGSDLMLITQTGILPISQALPFDPSATRSIALTNRIQDAMLVAAQYSKDFTGWQMISFPLQSLFFLNVPQDQSTTRVQYVMNTITGAWTQFQGWNANCFEIFNDSLYFGDSSGNTNLAYTAGLDKVDTIFYDMKCAFNYFDEPGRLKNGNMIRPFLIADGTLTPNIQIDVDFETSSPSAPVTILNPAGALWDSSLWDSAVWSTGAIPVIQWLSCNALGTALAIRMTINLAGGGVQGAIAQSSVFDTGVFDTMVFDGNGSITASGADIPVLKVNLFEIVMEYGGPI